MTAPVPPPEAVEAVMKAFGCWRLNVGLQRWICARHGNVGASDWTDRGCPVAVKVAAAVVAALGHPNQDALARAWAEGKAAGLEQAADHVRTGRPNIRVNPYGGKP